MNPLGAPAASALSGVRILSLAEQYPGPFATMILADLGADVVMVERPAGGDPTRRFSGHFEALNRNKRSIAIDLKTEQGKELLFALAADADVLIEGFRPGVMDRLGLGAEVLRREFPSLVYVSVSSFGQTGPLAPRAGHDLSVQGMAGYVAKTAEPAPAPLPLADISSAMYAVVGILASLLSRRTTGSGVTIDVSMLDALVSWRSTAIVSALNRLGPAPYPPEDPGYGVFAVGDQGELFTLSISGEDNHWRHLCEALELTGLALLGTEERESRRDEVVVELREALRRADPRVLEDELNRRGVNLGRVNSDLDVALDAQVESRGMIVEVDGRPGLQVVRQPLLFDGESAGIKRGAPRLGEHTREILGEAGYGPSEINKFFDLGIIAE